MHDAALYDNLLRPYPGPFAPVNASLDGELCGVLPDGRTAFNLIQNATDTGGGSLVFFLFDLLHLDS